MLFLTGISAYVKERVCDKLACDFVALLIGYQNIKSIHSHSLSTSPACGALLLEFYTRCAMDSSSRGLGTSTKSWIKNWFGEYVHTISSLNVDRYEFECGMGHCLLRRSSTMRCLYLCATVCHAQSNSFSHTNPPSTNLIDK